MPAKPATSADVQLTVGADKAAAVPQGGVLAHFPHGRRAASRVGQSFPLGEEQHADQNQQGLARQ